MIALINIRLSIVMIALLGSCALHAMQNKKISLNGSQVCYLLCDDSLNCIQSFSSGQLVCNGNRESNRNKHIWNIEPFASLGLVEKQKLIHLMSGCYDNIAIKYPLVVHNQSPFAIDTKIKRVICDDGSLGFLIKYSKCSSSKAIPIPTTQESMTDEEPSDTSNEARMPFGFSFGHESENE